MQKQLSFITAERIIFYLCLAANVGIILFSASLPTLDAPSHMYNARLADYIIAGNSFIKGFCSLNTLLVPNLTDHYLFTFFCSFLSFASAEKVMQLLFVISFSISFRGLVWQFNKQNIGFSILAIPFSFTLLFYMGFYNFCLSFSLLFWIITCYIKWMGALHDSVPARKYVMLGIMLLLLYFTNGLAFLFAGLILSLYELTLLWPVLKKQDQMPTGYLVKKIMAFCLLWLPGIICFVIFLSAVHMDSSTGELTFKDMLKWVLNVRPLVVYSDEERYTRWFFYIIVLGTVGALYYRIKEHGLKHCSVKDVFLLVTVVTAVCYFTVPDSSGVGLMSERFITYLFIFFILWISMHNNFRAISWSIIAGTICVHFLFLVNVHLPVQAQMDAESKMVQEAGKCIAPNSVVLDVNATGNWVYGHFTDYIAEDKPLVIVPNYEPDYGWFGIKWKEKMTQIFFDGKRFGDVKGSAYDSAHHEVDYVFIHGNYDDVLHSQDWAGLLSVIQKKYTLAYTSPDGRAHVFKLNKG